MSGAPTGIAQLWPGWPCGGFVPAATAPCVTGGVIVGCAFRLGCTGRLKEAPTGISQRWFGWPCSGFRAATAPGDAVSVAGAAVGRFRGVVVMVSFSCFWEQATVLKKAAESTMRVMIFMGKQG